MHKDIRILTIRASENKLLTGLIIIILPVLLQSYNYFSPLWREQLADLNSSLRVKLDESPVITGSITITTVRDTLEISRDYTVNYYNGIVDFKDNFGLIKIEYAAFPQNLQKKYFRYKEQSETIANTDKVKKRKINESRYQDLKLNIKGNKTISISISDDEDFQLDQSLFLQINGELAENVNVQAQVSDSESPLTPEGSSRELSNLDKIFIRIYGREYDLGFGDLEHNFKHSYFLDFDPVFEGLKGSWKKGSKIDAGLGLTKSETRSLEMNGIEGKQGPYWLENSYSGDAVIVSGTEKVYLNGIEMQRGDDYTIDYAEGSITFRDEHFISSSDRIYTVYQYSDEDFRQTVYLGEANVKLAEGIGLSMGLYYLKDDAENPLSLEYSANDLDSLAAAGDKPAHGDGIYETEEGLGEYILLEEGYYQYVGLDSTGTYNISFYEAEDGDYQLTPDGYYEYAGDGAGGYLPGTQLSLPQMQANYYINSWFERGEFEINNEFLFSQNDLNTKSGLDDDDNNGWAGNLDMNWKKNADLFSPFAGIYWQHLSKNLFTFDPVGTASDFYESGILTDSLATDEYKIQGGFDYNNILMPKLVIKRQEAGDYRQDLIKTDVQLQQTRYFPKVRYILLNWEKLTKDTINYNKHEISFTYNLKNWETGLGYKTEDERGYEKLTSEKKEAYLQYDNSALLAKIYWENNCADSTASINTAESETAGFQFDIKRNTHNLKLNFAHRELSDTTKYDIGELNYRSQLFETVSLRSNYRIRNLDFYPRIKELVYVGDGLGSYNEDGEEDEEGDYDWEVTSIDYSSRESSVELTTDAGIDFTPSPKYPDIIKRMRISLDADITEQSTTSELRKLYLLQKSQLMNQDKTIYGRQNWKTSFWYDLYGKKLKLQVTFDGDERLDNRYQNGETISRSGEELSIRWKYSHNWNYELNVISQDEEDSRYNLESKNEEISFDIKHSPNSSQIYSIKLAAGEEKENDGMGEFTYSLTKIVISPSVNWYPVRGKRFHARMSYRHNATDGTQTNTWQKENRRGDVFIGDFSYDHQLSKYITFSVDYRGEKYPLEEFHNEVSMEIAAEF